MRQEQAVAVFGVVVAGASIAAGGNIVLRAVPASTVVTSGEGGSVFVDFIIQGTIVDDPRATGFTTTRAFLNDDDGVGTFSAAPLSVLDTTGSGGAVPDPVGRAGLFPSYRQGLIDPTDNSEVPNGALFPEGFGFLALNLSAVGNGQGIGGEWTNLYKARFTSVDLSERFVTVTIASEGGAYQSPSGLVIDNDVPATSITLFIPAPGASALGMSLGLVACRRRR